jgi:hypothetical protein
MNGDEGTARDRDCLLEHFAAELTAAAYPVALQYGRGGSWVDLELGLWRAMAETVRKWGRDARRPRSKGE